MGLDNGICVKRTPFTNQIEELKVFNYNWDKELKYDPEIVYYRKCWNVRNDILYIIGQRWTDEYEVSLTPVDIDNIIELLQSYNKDNWQESGGSIWEWDDGEWSYSKKIKQDIEKLRLLRKLMDKYNLEVYFYDSY